MHRGRRGTGASNHKTTTSTTTTTPTSDRPRRPHSVVRAKSTSTNDLLTTAIRSMGVRVKPKDRAKQLIENEKAKTARAKFADNESPLDNDSVQPAKDEIKSILPKVMTGTGKNRRLVEVGVQSSIFSTDKVPVLSFGDDTTGFSDAITSDYQYRRERRKQDEQLMWEHESKQITNLQLQLDRSKRAKSDKVAKNVIPGVEMTPELIAKSKQLVIDDALRKKQKQKKLDAGAVHDENLTVDDYDRMLQMNSREDGGDMGSKKNDEDFDSEQDGDDILAAFHDNKTGGKKHRPRQHEPEAVEERLSLKEEEIVKKIRMKAFQANMTISRYCNQHNISHLLPLFSMKTESAAEAEIDPVSGKPIFAKKRNKWGHDDDDDGQVSDMAMRKLDDLAEMSDDDAPRFATNSSKSKSSNNKQDDDESYWDEDVYDEYDFDADGLDHADYSDHDNNDDDDIDMDNSQPTTTHQKLANLAKKQNKKITKNTVELGNLTKPSIFLQSQPTYTSQYALSSFDQLKQTTAKGARLNPKKFTPKTTDGGKSDVPVDKGKTFIHRTRPMLPDATWTELGINPAIAGKLQSNHITNPTATQKLVIPYLIRKFNPRTGRVYVPPTVALQDYTGSGKTLAYGLPLISNVDPLVKEKMPPPSVIAAIRALQGTKVANPPPLETEATPLDEVDPNVRVIQYQDNQTFNNPLGIDPQTNQKIDNKNKTLHFRDDFEQDDILENDVDTLISTRNFIDRLSNSVDVFSLSPAEWEAHVFAQEKLEQEAAQQRKLAPAKRIPVSKEPDKAQPRDGIQDESMTGGLTIDASIFNSRVYSLEAIRLRRKKQIKAHLKKIFPFVPEEHLDPDAPQSTLQNIIVVPTKELALQITKELIKANPTTYTTDVPLQGSHQLYGDKNVHISTIKGKNPLNIRMATGQIDPILLSSLGVFLHKGIDKANTDAELSQYNQKRAYNARTGEAMPDPKLSPEQKKKHAKDQEELRPHPFVDFGKGHKFYQEDQAEYRKMIKEREKDHVLRVMRLRERQMQGEKLSKFEVGDIESLDQFEAKRQRALDLGLDWDPEKEYAKTIGMNANGFDQATAEMLDGDNDDLLGGAFEIEEDPRKLMSMDDATLMKKIDLFRTDFSKSKLFRSLSQQEQREFKSRIATIMTKNHLKSQDAEREAALRSVHLKKMETQFASLPPHERPKINFVSNQPDHAHPTIREENKEQYLKEVSDLLMEQMGGEKGDFVEVVRDKQPHVIVGTPSTIVNLIKSGAIQLPSTGLSPNQLKSIVFDECDHLARNENSLEHHSLLELLSLPTDQSVFVSASMTRDNARLLTRLGRRQDLFINNKKPQIETVTNMLTLPRPNYKALPEEVANGSYENAFQYAQDKVNEFNMTIEADPMALNEIVLSSPRAKKDRLKVLTERLEDPAQREHLVDKIVDTMYKQHFTPLIPDEVYQQSLQNSISRGKLSYSTTSDEYGEVLFLSAEDYKAESQPTEGNSSNSQQPQHDVHSLPIPPFVKQYYIAPPRLANIQQKVGGREDARRLKSNSYLKRVLKDNLALDLICQLKLRPLKIGDEAKVSFTSDAYQRLLDMHQGNLTQASPNQTPGQTLVDNQTDQQRNNNEIVNDLGGELEQENTGLDFGGQQPRKDLKRPSKNHTASSVCPGTILVFFNPRREEDMVGLFRQLKETGLNVGLYCGLSDRHQKHEVLTKNEKLDVILTNDSLSRGIDFKHLSMVINVDPPRATTTFIHRSGRVGRVGGQFRKAATVINIVDVVPETGSDQLHQQQQQQEADGQSETTPVQDQNIPKQTATYSLLKHAERTQVTVNPWPYVLTHNISRVYLRSLKAIVATDTEKQGIKRHLDRKRKTEEYVKARNVKLHKKGIIQTRDTGVFDLAPGYSDSAFQPQLNKASQSVAIHRIQAKVNERLRSGSKGNPWIQTNEDNKKKGHHKRSLKH